MTRVNRYCVLAQPLSMRLLLLSVFSTLSSARLLDEPLAVLAAGYQGNVVNVRTMQYDMCRTR
jgi:hypothetical protein